jgi:preprotein translocase subunit SecE
MAGGYEICLRGTTMMDNLKLGVAVLLLLGGVVAFHYYEDQMIVLRVLGMLVVASIALGIIAQTAFGRNVIGFVSGAQNEVRRVVWPSRAETIQTTLVVIVIVIVVGIFLWLLDMVLLWAVQLLTGQGN